ncbi:MAG: fatty acid desaturase [Candidatus Caenarcaniphilales bacterium]|nr:fatty acid desaturase [Candidatus Caenarcaniphilales bacterium]
MMNNSTLPAKRINWRNTIFFIGTPILALIGVPLWAMGPTANSNTVWLAAILAVLTGLSITAGYHRFFSHKTYEASWIVRLFFVIISAGAFQGPILEWALDHRNHHRYVDDKEKDPYSISNGFWWAHIIWIFYKFKDPEKEHSKEGKELLADPLVNFQYQYYVPLAIFVGFVLPTLIAASWGDPFGGFILAGVTKLVFTSHSTFLINSLTHTLGNQPYSSKHSSRDNWFTAILTCGEGYHNFHHEFPIDYRNGIRFYQWDPTKWFIRGLSFIGLTKNLKRYTDDAIDNKRTRMSELVLQH